jgi:hypothetical protein
MKLNVIVLAIIMMPLALNAQNKVSLKKDSKLPIINVAINNKPFTSFFFPDTLDKPVLYPISAPDGNMITRGFPLMPKLGDATDHPHHIGLWLNYENVNGLDFWNNSFAIPVEKKSAYGSIKMTSQPTFKSGNEGSLSYQANWVNSKSEVLLNESTSFVFTEQLNTWIIDRTTTLTAQQLVKFTDAKDGFLGLRVAHELQLPTKETKKFTDANGIVTTIVSTKDSIANGNYLNSNGIQGEDVWSKKANWCLLYGKMGKDTVSIAIIDHPNNIGYPSNWHARGYGLFAINPLGEKIFTNGKAERNLSLEKGKSVTFKYRIVIASNKKRLTNEVIEQLQVRFSKL